MQCLPTEIRWKVGGGGSECSKFIVIFSPANRVCMFGLFPFISELLLM